MINLLEHYPHFINFNCLGGIEFATFIDGEEERLRHLATVQVCTSYLLGKKRNRYAGCNARGLFRFACEAGHGYRLCHVVQNSCFGSLVVLDCIFNPGNVVQDSGIDASISSQSTSVNKGEDSLKSPIADGWGSRDFLLGERTLGYLSGKRHKEQNGNRRVCEYLTLQGSLLPGTMPKHSICFVM